MKYFSSLSDREWKLVEPLLPPQKRTRPPDWSKREILDGILYPLKNGCNWADLPKDFPPYSTVYWHYKQWRASGVFESIMTTLHHQVREKLGKKGKGTTLVMIDSQAVKNTCNASVDSKGFCFYKATNGIKRHLAVDTLGFTFFSHCTKANVWDGQGLIEMLIANIDYFKSKPVNIPKITLLLDQRYHPQVIMAALEAVYPEIKRKSELRSRQSPRKRRSRQWESPDLSSSRLAG